jgi:peptidoglycan hydrolase-like protein with peptidoglycan-binding domain
MTVIQKLKSFLQVKLGHKNIFRILFTILSILSILSSIHFNAQAAQNSDSYKLPFRPGETWKAGSHGMHTDYKGVAYDFFPSNNNQLDIFTPAAGELTRGCTAGGQTLLNLDMGNGDSFAFLHMAADSVGITEGQHKMVKQGEYIGKIFAKDGFFVSGNCYFNSEGIHLHMSFPVSMCNLRIDGYNFDCGNLTDCPDSGINVRCNNHYLGQTFRSTNQVTGWEGGNITGNPIVQNATGDYCESLKNRTWSIGNSGKDVYDLQFCLQNRNLYKYSEGFTSYFGPYTQARLNDWRSGALSPSTSASGGTSTGGTVIQIVGGNGGNTNFQTQVTSQPIGNSCEDLKKQSYTQGETSERVKELQDCMTANGYFKHPFGSTGYFGQVTNSALNAWKGGNITPTAPIAVTPTNSCDNFKNQSYNQGETSTRVKQLQDCMTSNGFFKHANGSTGYFGPVTQDALNRWRGGNGNSGSNVVIMLR